MSLNLEQLNSLEDSPPWDWPENTGTELLTLLRGSKASKAERELAVGLAGDLVVMSEPLAAVLLAIVRDTHETAELRARAAISFGPVLEYGDTQGFDEHDMLITERTFREIQRTLRAVYSDETAPAEVRRRALEASVCAPEEWHQGALRTAYTSRDRAWQLTAIYGMRHVRGFDDQILTELKSKDSERHVEAVAAAGVWALPAAWSHVHALITAKDTPKDALLAAIDAAAAIRPEEAATLLAHLGASDDEDIAGAVFEAIAMAEAELGSENFDDDAAFDHDDDEDNAADNRDDDDSEDISRAN